MKEPLIVPTTVFRETPEVSFYDSTILNSNGCDVVRHGASATSPPMDGEYKQFYVHKYQIDYNLCVGGTRVFELIYDGWDEPYHKVRLEPGVGSVEIPVGAFHRSISGPDGSILINQPIRFPGFSVDTEFIPVSERDNEYIKHVLATVTPVIWDHGRRIN